MATFIELHVFNSGQRVSINIDAINRIGEMGGKAPYGNPLHGYVNCMDGISVETTETYDQIQKAIMAESGMEILIPVHGPKVDA